MYVELILLLYTCYKGFTSRWKTTIFASSFNANWNKELQLSSQDPTCFSQFQPRRFEESNPQGLQEPACSVISMSHWSITSISPLWSVPNNYLVVLLKQQWTSFVHVQLYSIISIICYAHMFFPINTRIFSYDLSNQSWFCSCQQSMICS